MPPRRVVVVADDLIWSSRLAAAVERAGGAPVAVARPAGLAAGDRIAGAIVDLGGREYDGVAAVAAVAAAGLPVIAVAQHDDLVLRKRALAAGASRVYSYNKLFASGPTVIAAWLSALDP